MTSAQDVALTLAQETTYGTAVTAGAKAVEFLSEGLTYRKKPNESAAYRYGARVKSGASRAVITSDAGGELKLELGTSGFGQLFRACMGSSTSAKIGSTTVYQQLHTLGDSLPSMTVQKVLPALNADASFADAVYTFLGCMVSSWTLEVPHVGVATLALTLDARDVTTATPKTTPVYPAANHVLHFGGACLYTGTLTPPTTSALATATTPVANVKSITITGDNALSGESSYYFCGNGKKAKPWAGQRAISGSMTVEFTAGSPFVTAFLADTPMSLLLNLRALENGDEVVQVALSEVRLDGDLPKAGGTAGVIELQVPFTAFAGSLAQPIWVVNATYDTAI